MSDGTVPKIISPGQMKDLCTALGQTVPNDLPFDRAAELISNKSLLRSALEPAYYPAPKQPVVADSPATAIIKPASTIIRPMRPFDPTIFGQGWTIWRGPKDGDGLEGAEERDLRSFALADFDVSLIELETCLRRRERYTTGEVRLQRLISEKAEHIRLDPGHPLFFRDHPEMYPEAFKGKAIFWDGLTLRSPNGHRYAVYSIWRDGRVVLRSYWRDLDRRAGNPSALLASKHLA